MALLAPTVAGSPFSGTHYNNNLTLIENTMTDLGPWAISGLGLSIPGGLSVSVAAGVAVIGMRVTVASGFTISGLTPSTTNHLYLLQNGSGTSNTTGAQPAMSVKLGTCVTDAGTVLTVNTGSASGRQQKPNLSAAVTPFTITNPSPSHSFDQATVTLAQLAAIVTALIQDLQARTVAG